MPYCWCPLFQQQVVRPRQAPLPVAWPSSSSSPWHPFQPGKNGKLRQSIAIIYLRFLEIPELEESRMVWHGTWTTGGTVAMARHWGPVQYRRKWHCYPGMMIPMALAAHPQNSWFVHGISYLGVPIPSLENLGWTIIKHHKTTGPIPTCSYSLFQESKAFSASALFSKTPSRYRLPKESMASVAVWEWTMYQCHRTIGCVDFRNISISVTCRSHNLHDLIYCGYLWVLSQKTPVDRHIPP